MLGLMVGDALGAAVEGFPQMEIRALAQERWGTNTIEDFILAVHMGTFVSAGEPGMYRPATDERDQNFVPTGPPSNARVADQCARCCMYTDDTNACLALAASIAECGKVDATHAAQSYAKFFRDNEFYRGVPPTAKKTMAATLKGVSAEEVALPPHFPYPGGSFANGGAMRISPLGIACHSATSSKLRELVTAALLASHRHPEAIDFAVIQAAAVQYALRTEPSEFDVQWLLHDLKGRCDTEDMCSMIAGVAAALRQCKAGDDNDREIISQLLATAKRPGSGMGFQIASVHMAPCVLWAVCRHFADPQMAVKAAIDLGGDTDTTASMVGAIMGALHGERWCAEWAAKMENGPHGRDFAMGLAEKLARLDISS